MIILVDRSAELSFAFPWCRQVVSRTSNLDGEGGRWDSFEIALDAFNDMIEEQKEALKSVLDEEVITMIIMIILTTIRSQ
jgi:hypothetical protein